MEPYGFDTASGGDRQGVESPLEDGRATQSFMDLSYTPVYLDGRVLPDYDEDLSWA